MFLNVLQRYIPFLSRLTSLQFRRKKRCLTRILTPLTEAIVEMERRRKDPSLMRKIQEYLQGNIPLYATQGPMFCLARHLATPNFETLRFAHLLESLPYKVIISKDTHDRFVSVNPMKRALGKLPIYMGHRQKNGKYIERFQYISIVDMNSVNGKKFEDITTLWGQSLSDFHDELCNHFFQDKVQIVDDAVWISEHHRGNLLEHYKKFLVLFLAHGILFEDYLPEDPKEQQFVNGILAPAFDFVQSQFGIRPLITHLNPTTVESELFWISYPKTVLDIVQTKLSKKI